MKIGITGAGGFIGSRIMYKLLERGHDVIGIDNNFLSKINEINNQKIINADITDYQKMEKLFKDRDVILHLAAITGLVMCRQKPHMAIDVNLKGGQNIINICKKYNIGLIFPASMAIFGDIKKFPIQENDHKEPMTFYGLNKLFTVKSMEVFSKNSFPAYVFILSNVYGNHFIDRKEVNKPTVINKFLDQVKKGNPMTVYKPGSQRRNFIHVKDVARAFVLGSEKLKNECAGTKYYNIASERFYTVMDIAEMIKDKCNGQIKMVDTPRKSEIYPDSFEVDISRAKKDLGFECKYSVDKVIEESKV